MYKVVIPSAGVGSRIGSYTKFMNKGLVTINNKPAIAHIIEKFNDASEIIIILGYKASYMKQVISAFYPNKNIKFVYVDKYEGEGSGLGYTLSQAKHLLQCPFIFITNDTVIPNAEINLDPSIHGNWIGYNVHEGDNSQYRTVDIKGEYVTNINSKGVDNNNVYIGLAGIKDYESFWDSMNDKQSITVGEAHGLKGLNDIYAKEFKTWCDIGNMQSLLKTKELLNSDEFNILEKDNEAIWFHDGKVIKFSTDESFILDRVKRLEFLDKDMFPQIINFSPNVYVYKMVEGNVLTKQFSVPKFLMVLNTINDSMWQPYHTTVSKELEQACYNFYKTKTYERVDLFHTKFEVKDHDGTINDEYCPKTSIMLDKIDWDWLSTTPFASRFHGDFHNENILVDKYKKIILIDWRQNFGKNNYEIGDVYYDLAKLYHGLIVSHEQVHRNNFTVDYTDISDVKIDILRTSSMVDAEIEYMKWLESKGFDIKKVKILTALIFLNIAALHEFPYSMYLYYLGKQLLWRSL